MKAPAALNPYILLVSILVQLVLALFFGHSYDMRIFMATGYLVGTGQNPYIAQDLSAVFNDTSFQGMTSAGYPPPWLLVLGLLYRLSYAIFPNLPIYNLAIKIPILLANIALAYLVAGILSKHGAERTIIRRAWIFLLFCPFLLYFTTAWGQFDSIVTLLSLASLVLLYDGKLKSSALLLAMAISLKPTALPVLPVALLYLLGKSLRQAISYFITFSAGAIVLCILPFVIFRWDPTPILQGWNAQFSVAGAMSYLTFFELFSNSYQLPGIWWLLGLAWIPALGIGILVLRRGMTGFVDLLKKSTALVLLFFLARAWLSEPNVTLILPFVLILTSMGELNHWFLAAVWIFPLVFTIFNGSPQQLLFPILPHVSEGAFNGSESLRIVEGLARVAAVIPWEIAGWGLVLTLFRRSPAPVVTSGLD